MPSEELNLSQRTIFRLYWPLALSWIFMALEIPISVSILSRLPHPAVNTAALLILMAMAIWIESPVIDLLATSTTLAKDAQHYRVIRSFVARLVIAVTLVHIAIVLTPIFPFLTETVMEVPHDVASAARSGLVLMIPWSALIGWRRYLQGILIRRGRTRPISVGTAIRVTTISSVGFSLFALTDLSGIVIISIATMASVFNEAVFMAFVSRSSIRELCAQTSDEPPLTMGRLARFHFPLSLSTMVTLTGMPFIGAALARSPDAVIAMASWQVASGIIFLPRSITFALLEVVISRLSSRGGPATLRTFCIRIGAGASLVMLAAWLSRADYFVFNKVLGASPEIAADARTAFLGCALVPVLNAAMSYLRGRLTEAHMTVARLTAIGAGMVSLIVMLIVGVILRWQGVLVAAAALTISQAVELLALKVCWGARSRSKLAPNTASS